VTLIYNDKIKKVFGIFPKIRFWVAILIRATHKCLKYRKKHFTVETSVMEIYIEIKAIMKILKRVIQK
jgi:hypothetical protein